MRVKEALVRKYRNVHTKPAVHAEYLRLYTLRSSVWEHEAVLSQLEALTPPALEGQPAPACLPLLSPVEAFAPPPPPPPSQITPYRYSSLYPFPSPHSIATWIISAWLSGRAPNTCLHLFSSQHATFRLQLDLAWLAGHILAQCRLSKIPFNMPRQCFWRPCLLA